MHLPGAHLILCIKVVSFLGGCQNDGPLLGPLNTRCRMILRTQMGTIILTNTPLCFDKCFNSMNIISIIHVLSCLVLFKVQDLKAGSP